MTNRSRTFLGSYPTLRLRRSRKDAWSRAMVREHEVSPTDLIWPVFVEEGNGPGTPIDTLPGVSRVSLGRLVDTVGEAAALGIPAIALFPVVDPRAKTEDGEEACNIRNLICRAAEAVKAARLGIGVVGDVALDPYTTHGQDGLVRDGYVVNDETIEVLKRQAIVQAKAGCDIVAPSDMMDGRVGEIRAALDKAGLIHTRILSYAAKYASTFYGPFRDAVGSKAQLGSGDKRSYQMDFGNGDEALREVALDLAEGADLVMVKPGLPYLDIIRRVKDAFAVPTLAYQVSGEYAMIKFAAERGCFDADAAFLEVMTAFKRAGADAVFTYAALDIARLLKKG